MWQLLLLSQVLPAFGALAKEFEERNVADRSLADDARDCYSDLVNIGQALFVSRGQWTFFLKTDILTGLLNALETRLPRARGWGAGFFPFPAAAAAGEDGNEKHSFPRLVDLAEALASHSLGGLDECLELLDQSDEVRAAYLDLVGRKVSMFHKSERQSKRERQKFVSRVRLAGRHLLDVYCLGAFASDAAADVTLSQHPSYGVGESAEQAYKLLERHWDCCRNGHKQAAAPAGEREARLSLIRHRQMAPMKTMLGAMARSNRPAQFEVLLPVYRDMVEWKVTRVEVRRHPRGQAVAASAVRERVKHDLYRRLFDSDRLRVDLAADGDALWHCAPDPFDTTAKRYLAMQSLSELLGSNVAVSHVAQYTPLDKLKLCYVLANAMLFFYPGSWLQPTWSSARLYFARCTDTDSRAPVALAFPYLSAELQPAQQQRHRHEPLRLVSHPHPAVLALGIIFLEIATGTRFDRSAAAEPWLALNYDIQQAWRTLQDLEKIGDRDRSRRPPPALVRAIRSCLKLDPPASIPADSLAQEGPIRQYILSCIIQPLAVNLKDGYKVSLEALDRMCAPEAAAVAGSTAATTGSHRPMSVASRRSSTDTEGDDWLLAPIAEKQQREAKKSHTTSLLADARDANSSVKLGDRDKVRMANRWFAYHDVAAMRIRNELRNHDVCNARRVKIAILDSGLSLSGEQREQCCFDGDNVVYRSFVEPDEDAASAHYWVDEVGHGTHLAVLLRRIAENAIVCVARAFAKSPRSAKSAASIAKALRYAVDEWQVDIIVMAFGFDKEIAAVSRALDYADYKKVLLFAAASNDGKNRPDGVAWPASRRDVFCVHAADGHGNPSSFTPSPQDSRRLMVLGECVRSAWPPDPRDSTRAASADSFRLMSGTSCAAPIAAGIAAVVLDYARGFLDEPDWQWLRRYESMQRMFEALKDGHSTTGYWWIRHWTLFDAKKTAPVIEDTIRAFVHT